MDKFNYKILYIEDDTEIRRNYENILSSMFNTVFTAKDGLEGYESFNAFHPDIVILDINMPKLDGLALASKIRKKDSKVTIVFFTAYDEKEKLMQAIDSKASKYLIKPISLKDFKTEIFQVVQDLQLDTKYLRFNKNLFWDIDTKTMYKYDKPVKLSKKEYELILLFEKNPTLVIETDDILNYLWDESIQNQFDTKPIRSLLFRLKTKLGYQIFESIYNVGYRLKLLWQD